ncbi:hypothetical protein [Burkholderia pseudomallei]|uniref:hypothetical protein n=1 Tax=Burkholderia pseudomallei TaxID=28450 RepID=UPI00050E1AD4|nr:hypothetical protein [Burkholderia pseudomallei]KGD05984.1 hypothetical protein DO63_2301 [Burkholderia pseudomallei]
MAKQIPQRAEGWKFKGAAGRFAVWHAGKNDYRITEGHGGDVIATRDQFGLAYAEASRRYALDAYYADRADGGQAALTAHR